jgi:hypothetical protein
MFEPDGTYKTLIWEEEKNVLQNHFM